MQQFEVYARPQTVNMHVYCLNPDVCKNLNTILKKKSLSGEKKPHGFYYTLQDFYKVQSEKRIFFTEE